MAETNDFKIWALNVLPIVFDDYLSQKDLFVKLVRYVNGLLGDAVTLYNDYTAMETGTIGELEDLHTTDKDSIVDAINEVEDDVEALKTDKLDAPTLAGTSGQVLTSDGEGGQVWAAVGSGEIVVDNTLTVSGAAADAKKTGDEITSVKADITNVNGSWIRTEQVNNDLFTITDGKKITGYDVSTYLPILANGAGSVVADFAVADLKAYGEIKVPRCTISAQWIILYGSSTALNFTKSSTTSGTYVNLSNANYGIIKCDKLSTSNYTRIAIAFDGSVDVITDTQFDTFFDLMNTVKANQNAEKNVRKLWYSASIDITVQSSNAYVPFLIFKDEQLTFTNKTSGNIALNAIATDGSMTVISSGVSSGNSVTFTADKDYVRFLYWSQQLGEVVVENNSSVISAMKSEEIASVNMFSSIAAIGDSYTAGSTKNSGGSWVDYRNLSWIATMGKRSGTEWENYGHGGTTTKTYLETTEFANALSDTACGIYFFALGQNDANQGMTIGTVSDIHDSDYTQNADTFYGNYGRIIQQIKNHAPNAKLVMITNWVQGSAFTDYDTAIRGIATHYSIPVINPFDDYFFNSSFYSNYKEYGHPTAMGYSSMGLAMERLFSKCVLNNPQYFKFATIG